MKSFKFEIQSLIVVIIKAEDIDEARNKVLEHLEDGVYDNLLSEDANVSDGKEITK